ncbi:MAG: lipocalin family protein [Pseudomonadota bacterium]|nr:lipocalin family protein [Pseudomonadota bacterium]
MSVLIRMAALVAVSLSLSACRFVDTVPFVDVPRYMGTWYQIAANEVAFNEGLVGVTAQYTLLDDGSVEVYNRGLQDSLDGEVSDITGNATIWDEETNSKLKVVFPGAPDLPYPNYLIVVLDDVDYQYAAVTDPFEYTLFILSRTPTMDDNTYAMILGELEALEVDTSKLLLTPQP